MDYRNPNLVLNKPEIFLDIEFGLTWISDSDASKELRNHFLTEECVYPDIRLMRHFIQEYADHSRDYLNRLYQLQLANLTYNPVENYDRKEDWDDTEKTATSNDETGKSKSTGSGDAFEFPMDDNTKKQTSHTDTTADGDYSNTSKGNVDRKNNHTGRVHGNIGVTTGAQMIQGEIDISKIVHRLKDEFCKQYDDLFMITI